MKPPQQFTFPRAEMRLDVGAVAKGYAVERVAQDLEAKRVASLLLSVGGISGRSVVNRTARG